MGFQSGICRKLGLNAQKDDVIFLADFFIITTSIKKSVLSLTGNFIGTRFLMDLGDGNQIPHPRNSSQRHLGRNFFDLPLGEEFDSHPPNP